MIDASLGPGMVEEAIATLPPGFAAEIQFNEWQPVDDLAVWKVLPATVWTWEAWRIFTGSWAEPTGDQPSVAEVVVGFREWPVASSALAARMASMARILESMRPQLQSVDQVFRQGNFSVVAGSGLTRAEVESTAEQFLNAWAALAQALQLYHGWLGRYRYWHWRGLV